MIRIQTLGGLAAFDGTRPLGGNTQQPRRLAILAVLSRAGDRGVNRDRLATLLWGEVEEERARRSLNQALYALRHDLGSEEAILGTRELRLNPELIEIDLVAFETAKASGALEEAVRLYTGPFLGDFHLPGVPAFAHWAEEERSGLAAEYRDLLEAVAVAASKRDDRGAAVLWWRRLAALDPTETTAALGLMRALAAAGDAPAALRQAEIVNQIRQQELELPPDPAIETLAERIRRGEYAPPPAAAVSAAPPELPGPIPADPALAGQDVPLALPTPDPVPPSMPLPSRRIPAIATALVLLIVAGVGLFLLRPRVLGRAHSPAPKRLAVLPFENQGDPADAYFADGITDELRGKLTAIPGLEVVASQSSNDYRATTKPLPQIARDLGVSYLLVGKIRWQKGTGGSSRVQVSPELVRIAPGTAPTTRWQQPFDASLTDVFQVQADIAAKVAGTLDVLLGDSTRRELIAAPTASLAAYDEFLKGEAASQGMKAAQADLRRAIGFYQRAVKLDSTFVDAWSQLSRARTSLYSNGVPDTTLARQAQLAAERAQQLRPNDPLVYLAVGDFYSSVNPVDNARAGAEYERGLRLAPDDVDLLSASAISDALVGRWSDVAQRLQRALQLDPRSLSAVRRLATAYIFLRQNAAADSAVDRAADIAPTNPQMALLKTMVALQRGDLGGARAVVRAATRRIDPATLLVFIAMYQDLYWVLDPDQQQQVLRLPPSAFDDDRGSWGIVRAEIYALRGDRRRTEIYADSARKAFAEQLRAAPEDAQRHVFLGLSLAYLGQKDDAIREGLRGVELMPISRDGFFGPYVKLQLVRIYILTGEPEQAMDQLEPLLHIPFYVSPGWLRVDPTFNSLRTNPRFRKLVEERR